MNDETPDLSRLVGPAQRRKIEQEIADDPLRLALRQLVDLEERSNQGAAPHSDVMHTAALAGALAQIAQAQNLQRIADRLDGLVVQVDR